MSWSFEIRVKAQGNDSEASPSFEDGMHAQKWKKNDIGTFLTMSDAPAVTSRAAKSLEQWPYIDRGLFL